MQDSDSTFNNLHDILGKNLDRRKFLLFSAAAILTGCGGQKTTTNLPGVPWPESQSRGNTRHTTTNITPRSYPPTIRTEPAYSPIKGVLLRSKWTSQPPAYSKMNRMLPTRYITIHHDGMDAFTGTSERASANRIELIRKSHRNRDWGDIGYHYVVDRAGRVWEARPLTYQGAHVKNYNEGNIGVLAMGNFDLQYPSREQVAAVESHVAKLMLKFNVPTTRVRTHQEWAPTACPGRNMQSQVRKMRVTGVLA